MEIMFEKESAVSDSRLQMVALHFGLNNKHPHASGIVETNRRNEVDIDEDQSRVRDITSANGSTRESTTGWPQ